MNTPFPILPLFLVCVFAQGIRGQPSEGVGEFSDQSDVGVVRHAGDSHFDAAHEAYVISGSGANMWFANDAFHFVWKKVSGDVNLSADIHFLDTNKEPHRKACLM